MNVENIHAVADAIETEAFGLKYNQAEYVTLEATRSGCGSTACVFGMAALILAKGDTARVTTDDPNFSWVNHIQREQINDWFGLDWEQSDAIYFAQDRNFEKYPTMSDIPREQAVRTLRHLAATGEVDWTV